MKVKIPKVTLFVALTLSGCTTIAQPKAQVTIPSTMKAYSVISPETLPVYVTQPENITTERARQIAKSEGLSHPIVRSKGERITVQQNKLNLIIHAKTGARFYQDSSKMWGANDAIPVKRGEAGRSPAPDPVVPPSARSN